ncbi:hypothetical protein A3D88_04265 [Candidatus Peribacteria bacterium RIFCSPHIGHO2_02_FULL_52_16]|nr:MAG: hypothetical protein A2706_01010 [Candidatus Peribacteria bacterium RIFCSPHIGHO2_01_FULL_51_35]OGJ60826.1 MAG: hypothetical protein A3D88_04265 [Candidatus Peribacteria bacterium RIFCSPHIGHO2_02_FULL_52_16]
MTSLLFGIILSALLSTTSLLIVVFRVSPLSSPGQALPAFFGSVFLSVSSIAALILFAIWRSVPVHTWDAGRILSISLRQGIFLGLGTIVLILFHLLGLLNWWIALLIYAVFVLIELAMNH